MAYNNKGDPTGSGIGFITMLAIVSVFGLLMFGGAIEAARIVTGRGVW